MLIHKVWLANTLIRCHYHQCVNPVTYLIVNLTTTKTLCEIHGNKEIQDYIHNLGTPIELSPCKIEITFADEESES